MSKIKIKKKINKYPNGGNLKNAYSITADALSLFPPTSGLGYVMGLPTTAYDMYEDYQKGDIKQMGLDAMGLIPAFKIMKYSKFAKSATQGINIASKFNKAVDVANMANDVNQTIEKKEFGGNITTENNNMKAKIKKGKKLPKALHGFIQENTANTTYEAGKIQFSPIGKNHKFNASRGYYPIKEDATNRDHLTVDTKINLGDTTPKYYDFGDNPYEQYYDFNEPTKELQPLPQNTATNYTYPAQDYGELDESLYTNTPTKRPQEQTYQMESLQPQLLPQNNQLPTSLTPITQNQSTPKTNINWNNSFPGITGLGGNTFLSKGISQLGSGLTNIGKGTLDMFGNMKMNNRQQYNDAKKFQQSVYSDAEKRPQKQINGQGILGGNHFADGGMNIKEIGGQGEPKFIHAPELKGYFKKKIK